EKAFAPEVLHRSCDQLRSRVRNHGYLAPNFFAWCLLVFQLVGSHYPHDPEVWRCRRLFSEELRVDSPCKDLAGGDPVFHVSGDCMKSGVGSHGQGDALLVSPSMPVLVVVDVNAVSSAWADPSWSDVEAAQILAAVQHKKRPIESGPAVAHRHRWDA